MLPFVLSMSSNNVIPVRREGLVDAGDEEHVVAVSQLKQAEPGGVPDFYDPVLRKR